MPGQTIAPTARMGRWAVIAAVMLGSLVLPVAAEAQQAETTSSGVWAPLESSILKARPAAGRPRMVLAPPSTTRALPKLSDVVVTYHGFGPSAKAAFEAAVAEWERLVRSPVQIRVDATWTPMGSSSTLAVAGANGAVRGFPGQPRSDTYYPMPLADRFAGRDLYPGRADIVAEVNSNAPWSYATSPTSVPGKYDLVGTVLHELGHGLGFDGSLTVSGSVGRWSDYPTPYDRLVTDASGTPVINAGNGTAALKQKLTSGKASLGGAQAVATAGRRVALYSPSTFDAGSSIYHLDPGTYAGAADSLMTPYLAPGDIVRDPGNISLAVLRDVGWTTTSTRLSRPGTPTLSRVSAGNHAVTVAWSPPTDNGRQQVTGYKVLRYTNGSSTPDETATLGPTARTMPFTWLTNGTVYRFKVVAFNQVGDSPGTPTSEGVRPLDIGPFPDVDALLLRLYVDIVHKGPSSSVLASRRTQLNSGTTSPGATIVQLMGDGSYTRSVPPVVRLYKAYFKRMPDQSGLAYWAGQLRAGRSLTKASDQFVVSSEFVRTYGSLSNSAFVDLVYQNVLGRSADSAGKSYWLGKMAKGTTRGSVMLGFSESSENVRKTANEVSVVGLRHVMLGAVPSPSVLSADVGRLASGGASLTTLAGELLLSSEYRAHIAG